MIKFLEKLYYLYWHEYRCRLEPWTYEWRRYTKKWWWMILVKAGVLVGGAVYLLVFPPFNMPFWGKILVIVTGVIVVAFYSWLLLHLGGFALWIINKIRGK
jgi:hypothetical protein